MRLVQPTFVRDYLVELSPFAKRHRSEGGLVERWEAIIGGIEIANAFTELNDPDEQRRRFEQQAEELRRGDVDAQPYARRSSGRSSRGCRRPAGDRPLRVRSIREVVLFPAMRS